MALAGKISEPVPHVQELAGLLRRDTIGETGRIAGFLVGPVEKGEPGTSIRPPVF